MKMYIKMTYLLIVIALNFTCAQKKSSEKLISKTEFESFIKNDTLLFTSGIRVIFQDSKGHYWFGSHREGVCHYDGKTFEYFKMNSSDSNGQSFANFSNNEGLLANEIFSIQEDKNGKFLIETSKGLSIYDGLKFTNYPAKTNEPKTDWNSTSGDTWFYAGEKEGINRLDGENISYLVFPKPKKYNPNDSYGVTDISKDKSGKIWIATYAALFNYDGENLNIFDEESLKLKVNEKLHIRSLLLDSKGRVWIGNNGIGALLMENDETINFSDKNGLIHMFSSRSGDRSPSGTMEHVFAIEEDADGNIWFGDRDTGAWRYDGKAIANYTIDEKLRSKMIWTIYKDNYNNLLFGMITGGVYRFNGKSFDRMF